MLLNVYGIGEVVSDPMITDVGDTCKVEFMLLTTESRRNTNGEKQKENHTFPAEAWDSAAEYIYNNLKKGDKLYVECLLKRDKWEKDGVKKSKDVLRLTHFKVVS
jgi:single-stranded DNA-binding protein